MNNSHLVIAINLLNILLRLFVIFIAAVLFYWRFLEAAPLKIFEYKLASSGEIRQGGYFEVKFTSIKYRFCPVTVQYILRDSQGVIHQLRGPSGGWNRVLNKTIKRSLIISIPQGVPVGNAVFHERIVYQCNPLWTNPVRSPLVFLKIKRATNR